ncbi:RNA 2',3'-cyclic phosphodiesterase [Candidatus Poribacteria bacterium]|nr:RNA 2',3'-cyclic phosphodiesterase [Candidatus Poribacteria bacterium]
MDRDKSAVIRCFVAVEIPEPIQASLKPVQTHLQSHIHKGISWTKFGNFHLTLKFLGDVYPDAIDNISEAIQHVTDTHPPFSIAFGGIGAFPNLARPRVIWMGIKQGASTISRLAKAVNLELTDLGFTTDNRFHPHLTLARLRTATDLEPLKHILRKYDTIVGGSMRVNEIALMQSQLRRNGAIYTPLSVCHFSA